MVTMRWHVEVNPRRWGLRVQSAIIVALVVTATVAIYAGGFVVMMYRSLDTAADEAAATRVEQVISQLHRDRPGHLDPSVLTTGSRIVAVQVVDDHGVVIEGSSGAPATPMTHGRPPPGVTDRSEQPDREHRDYKITTATTTQHGHAYQVIVATSHHDINQTVSLAAALAAIGAPFVVAIACLATYLVIGRALRSVESIRRRVAAISNSALAERVPVPEARDEISALAHTMNAMLARVEAGHRAQQRFVSDASHELRSPLSTITTALQVGQRHADLLDADMVRTTLLPETRRMRRLIDDLLVLARIDERTNPLRLSDVDLDDLVADEVRRAQTATTKTLVTTLEPIRLTADRAQLGRALGNVIDNAVQYATHSVSVELSHAHAGYARLAIGDDGPGIAEAESVRVFDRFYRIGDDRARGSGGSGLGLAITAEIIRVHHGTIRIDPSTTGTLVVIFLPRSTTSEPLHD